jgi:preprotein translocase subunit YajC
VTGIIEFVEQGDELVAGSGLHAEIVDVKEIAFIRERFLRHRLLL